MKYLVCRPRNSQTCFIQTFDDPDQVIAGEFSVWTMRSGKQVMFLERRLGKELERHHLGGAYQAGAMYAMGYEQMCMVLEHFFGPSDRARYLALTKSIVIANEPGMTWAKTKLLGRIVGKTALLACFMVWRTVTMLLWFGIIGILLAIFNKHRK